MRRFGALLVLLCIMSFAAQADDCAHVYGGFIDAGENHYRECGNCGDIEYSAHRMAAGDCVTRAQCADCGKLGGFDAEKHTGGAARCGQRRVCVKCGQSYGYKLQHDYVIIGTFAPGCDYAGSIDEECRLCHKKITTLTRATGHYYGDWRYSGDGAHSADCVRCDYVETVGCSSYAYSSSRDHIDMCPICGYATNNGVEIAPFEKVVGAWWGNEDAHATPEYAEILVMAASLPGGRALYSIVLETCGLPARPAARIWVTIPLSGGVKSVSSVGKVDYDFAGGVLTIITDRAGLYLLTE